MTKKLIFLRTHILEWYVLVEYAKLCRSINWGDECILFIDNSKNIVDQQTMSPVQIDNFNGIKAKCFLYNYRVQEESGLPYYTDNPDNKDSGNLLYYNGDYPFYYIRKYFPDFDYYWCSEYDVFCNGKSYRPFFKKFEKNNSDFICAEYRLSETQENKKYNSEWIYKKEEHYRCFFPILRLSAKAVDHLYQTRIEHGKLFEKVKNPDTRWIYCETFVSTELSKHNFKCSPIENECLRYKPDYNLNKERVFEFPDNKLYHPVR